MTASRNVYAPQHSSSAKSVLAIMLEKDFDMAPIFHEDGRVTSYVLRKDLQGGSLDGHQVSKYARPLGLDRILSSSTPILKHLQLWEEHSYYLVLNSNKLAGIVTYADLNKAPVRLIFFTILSEIEAKLRRLIRRKMPNDKWLTFLAEGRRRRIESDYRADKEQNLEVSKTIYLMFGELLSLFDHDHLYEVMDYQKKAAYVSTRVELNRFRNSIMHSKPLVTRAEKMRPTLKSKLDLLLQFTDRIPIKTA